MEKFNLANFVIGTGLVLGLLTFPKPSKSAGFFVGCNTASFTPSDTCARMCNLLSRSSGLNLTSCCYGVNHSGRTACSCCDTYRRCPEHCSERCVIVALRTENCAGGNILEPLTKEKPLSLEGLFAGGNSDFVYYSEPELIVTSSGV